MAGWPTNKVAGCKEKKPTPLPLRLLLLLLLLLVILSYVTHNTHSS
jgi:hypothetical protein